MSDSGVKWIKISTNVFNDDAFQLIDDMPEADAIELIWFKLLIFAGKSNNNGLFLYKDTIAYTDEMLASVFHRPVNIVRLAMKTFEELFMIEKIEGVYTIPKWDKYQTLDAYEQKKLRDKEYSKKYREKQKSLLEEKVSKTPLLEKSSDESSDVSRFCSYSYSKSNNLSNLNYLLNSCTNNKYLYEIDYVKSHEKLNSVIRDWMEYKDGRGKKEKYTNEKSLLMLIRKFVNADREHGTDAVEKVVVDSITNQYQGIIWDKIQKGKKNEYNGNDQRYIEGTELRLAPNQHIDFSDFDDEHPFGDR